MNKKWIISIAAVGIILLLPMILSSYGIRLASEFYIMSIFSLSLGLIMGYVGLTSFGHAAFFGAGVYTVALLSEYISNTYLLFAASILIAGLLAFISGILFVRMPGAYFFMLTLSFNQLLYVFFYQMKNIAGGADGMLINATPNLGFGEIVSSVGLYYLAALSFLLCFIFLYFVIHSPMGKVIIGIKENELRMKALGYHTGVYKVLAYTISGAMGGFAGSLYAFFNLFASPEIISFGLSGQVLVMVMIGGAGTLLGPVIGALIFVVLQSYISSFTDYWSMIMGALFVVLVMIGRGGIVHLFMHIWKKTASFHRRSKMQTPLSVSAVADGKQMGGDDR
jgi:ABC-type branched-chain amino acid transport system, permease component